MKDDAPVHLLGIAAVVYTRETGHDKPVARPVPLDVKQQKSLLNFIAHRLHGGRLRLTKLPSDREAEKPLIVAP